MNCDCDKPIIRVGWKEDNDNYHIVCLNCDKSLERPTISEAEREWIYLVCPCSNKCREECDICKTEYDIKIGEQRKMNTAQMIPREKDKRVQDILYDGNLTLQDMAKKIYSYDDSCLSREYDRRKPDPGMTERQIFMVLVERLT